MDIYEMIGNLTDIEIGDVLDAVLRRYAQLFPAWEIGILSICKSEDRSEQIDRTIQMLQNMKTSR